MNELLVVEEKEVFVITVNNGFVGVIEKEISQTITIGIPGPQGPSASAAVIYQAGEILSGHRIVLINSGKAYYASSSNLSHVNKILGITTGAAELNADVNIKIFGELEEPSWNWDITKPIYAGLNGALTQAAPSAGFIQQIATVITSNKIFINLKSPIIIN